MSKLIPPTNSIDVSFTQLQDKAWKYLIDKKTNIVLFGGSANVGKTFLGCSWIVLMCLQYPGIVCGATRARIIDFRKSTQITLLNVMKSYGLVEGINYSFDRQVNIIQFYNQSKIIIFDSYYYVSDPLYDRIGSIELTYCLLDEASQISQKALQIIITRLRFKHLEYQLVPKVLIVTNPCNNHIKKDIYDKFIEGTLEDHIKVVLGTVDNNPYADKSYKQNLERLDEPTKQRLLYGNWQYNNSDLSIFDIDQLINCFYNTNFINNTNIKYLTCDVASSGTDRSVITIWNGLECIDIQVFNKKTIPQLHDIIRNLMSVHNIFINNIVIDRTGIGTGLCDMLPNCNQFIAASKPTNPIYGIFKDEIWYKFAEYINNGRIYISKKGFNDDLISELNAHIMYDYDKDGKTKILPKDKVKQILGKSPDLADAIVLRMVFEVKKTGFGFSFVK